MKGYAINFAILVAIATPVAAQVKTIVVPLEYHAPQDGQPKPNFSPKGTQIPLRSTPFGGPLPAGSIAPAKTGVIKVGPNDHSYLPILITSDSANPQDLTRLFIDRNRNGDFTDDGPAMTAAPAQNAKTKAWWTSINKVELNVPYGDAGFEPYLVNFWVVRDDSTPAPDVIRYSVNSWRSGKFSVNGVNGLIAAMDGDNNALFTKDDMWSAVGADEPNAEKAVLSIDEARPTNRLMFLEGGAKEQVLEFRSFSPDGRSVTLAVIDKPVTKAADRGPDDMLREERPRPRTTTPVAWEHGRAGYTAALAAAKKSGRKIILDFEATWCGPCHTMDQWIWNDAEVATDLNGGYIGVKIDVDENKPLVARYKTTGYPTMIILDSKGKEVRRVADYMSSKQMLEFLRKPDGAK